jgi:hypothetical protein
MLSKAPNTLRSVYYSLKRKDSGYKGTLRTGVIKTPENFQIGPIVYKNYVLRMFEGSAWIIFQGILLSSAETVALNFVYAGSSRTSFAKIRKKIEDFVPTRVTETDVALCCLRVENGEQEELYFLGTKKAERIVVELEKFHTLSDMPANHDHEDPIQRPEFASALPSKSEMFFRGMNEALKSH